MFALELTFYGAKLEKSAEHETKWDYSSEFFQLSDFQKKMTNSGELH